MPHTRIGEHGNVPDRSGRFIQKEDYWYYQTREGVDIGPFDTRHDAEIGVGEFIDYICSCTPEIAGVIQRYCAA